MSRGPIGAAHPRLDARAKVTGEARYSGDVALAGMLHAAVALSAVPRARDARVDATPALALPGVELVLARGEDLGLRPVRPPTGVLDMGDFGCDRLPLTGGPVEHVGEIVALVVADRLAVARQAAGLVAVAYDDPAPPDVELEEGREGIESPSEFWGVPLQERRGDADRAHGRAAAAIDERYATASQHHHPMEPHATVASWDGDRLTVHEGSQWIGGAQKVYADVFGLPRENVRVLSRYIGGGFGAKGATWGHGILAAVAARRLGRPVRIVLPRRQMSTLTGHRPRTQQRVRLGSDEAGGFVAIRHDTLTETARSAFFVETCGEATSHIYDCADLAVSHRLARLDLPPACHMRTPGEAPGLFALESAIDELADRLGLDPLELRRRNRAQRDPSSGRAWAGNRLDECYQAGAEWIGWDARPPRPGSMRDGNLLIGLGMATATFPGSRSPAHVRVEWHPDGRVVVASGCADMGTGAATVLAQIAAEELSADIDQVEVHLGDSAAPAAPGSFAAQTTASVGGAVQEAARQLRRRYPERPTSAVAVDHRSDGQVDPTATSQSFGATFARVGVDAQLGTVTVQRLVGAFDVGRVVNPTTTRSQLLGGMVFGIGMALMEETPVDVHAGRYVGRGLADYHVAVNADVRDVEALTLGDPDTAIGTLGARGAGEIGNAGTAAAIANAVFHATGCRVRELPLTPDRVLAALAARTVPA